MSYTLCIDVYPVKAIRAAGWFNTCSFYKLMVDVPSATVAFGVSPSSHFVAQMGAVTPNWQVLNEHGDCCVACYLQEGGTKLWDECFLLFLLSALWNFLLLWLLLTKKKNNTQTPSKLIKQNNVFFVLSFKMIEKILKGKKSGIHRLHYVMLFFPALGPGTFLEVKEYCSS